MADETEAVIGKESLASDPGPFASEAFCYLTTKGRVTGRPRTIEIWFALSGATLYMLSGNQERADWVKNAMRAPRVTIKIGESVFDAEARIAKDNTEESLARRLLFEKYSPRESGLDDWARTALPVAFDLILPAAGA